MYHYSDSFSSPMLGRAYFLLYITLASFVMLNMFTLVVTQQFEEFYFNTENPVTCYQDIEEEFKKTWNIFTWKTNGEKIKERNLIEFFSMLKSPLGYRYVDEDDEGDDLENLDHAKVKTIISKQEIAKLIFLMDLPVDHQGYIPYGIVIHAASKNGYGKKFLIDVEKEAFMIIRRIEIMCMAEMFTNHNKL